MRRLVKDDVLTEQITQAVAGAIGFEETRDKFTYQKRFSPNRIDKTAEESEEFDKKGLS